jgi:AcrR family transcriptional regulator
MAKSTASGGRRRNSTAAPQSDADRIIDAALARMVSEGWRQLSLAAIAEAAGLPILQVYRIFGSKQAILRGLYRKIDQAVLAQPPQAEAEERPRDRLFDLLMRRFDALKPHRPALKVLRRELVRDPVTALCGRLLIYDARLGARRFVGSRGHDGGTRRAPASDRALARDRLSSRAHRRARSRLILLRCKKGLDASNERADIAFVVHCTMT